MYPVVPDLLQKFTVSNSQNGDDVRATTVTKAQWHGAPSFETGDLGRGTQLTKVWANGVELILEREHPVDLAYHDTSALKGEMAAQGHAYWDTESISTNTPTSFVATYSNAASGDEITVSATAVQRTDGRPDYIRFELAGSGVSISTSGKTLGGWEWPRIAVRPPAEGNSERGLSIIPYIRGQASPLPYQPFPVGDIGCVWPDAGFGAGNTINGALEGNLHQPSSFQFTHVYDRDSFAGALMIVADPETNYKSQIQGGTGTAHKMRTRHLPPNGRGRTTLGTSDQSGGYSVRLIPFRGEVNDAATEYRRTVVEDLEPEWLPSKTLDDFRGSTLFGWGAGQSRSGMFATGYWWTVFQFANYNEAAGANRGKKAGGADGSTTNGAGEGLTEAETVARISTAYTKMAEVLGEDADGALAYGLSDEEPWAKENNDHWWNFGEDIATFFNARVTYFLAYTLVHEWSTGSEWFNNDDTADPRLGYSAAIGDPNDTSAQFADGTYVETTKNDTVIDTITFGGVAASFTDTYRHPNWGLTDTQDHVIDLLNRRWIEGDAANGITVQAIDGVYLDALTMLVTVEDYRATLTNDQKGFSSFQADGVTNLVKRLRTEARPKNDFGYFSEWPNEPAGLNLDGLSISSNPINFASVIQAPINLCVFPMIWSEYVPRIDFYSSFVSLVSLSPLVDNSLVQGEAYGDVWDLTFQQCISQGSVVFLQSQFANRADTVPTDPDDPTDPSYLHWRNWMSDSFTFMKNTFAELRAAGANPGIFQSRMLRELDDSTQRNFIDDRIIVTAEGITGAAVGARVWYAQTPRPAVFIILTNAAKTSVTYRLKMDRGRYPELPVGLLGLTRRGVETKDLGTFRDVLDTDVTIPAQSCRVYKIERALVDNPVTPHSKVSV